jgi:hypothetical protein
MRQLITCFVWLAGWWVYFRLRLEVKITDRGTIIFYFYYFLHYLLLLTAESAAGMKVNLYTLMLVIISACCDCNEDLCFEYIMWF